MKPSTVKRHLFVSTINNNINSNTAVTQLFSLGTRCSSCTLLHHHKGSTKTRTLSPRCLLERKMKGLKALTIFVGLVVVSPILIDGQTTSDNTRMTEVDLPLVGILNFQPICEGYDTNGTADEVHVNCSLGQMMEYAMEKDDLLKGEYSDRERLHVTRCRFLQYLSSIY